MHGKRERRRPWVRFDALGMQNGEDVEVGVRRDITLRITRTAGVRKEGIEDVEVGVRRDITLRKAWTAGVRKEGMGMGGAASHGGDGEWGMNMKQAIGMYM